MIFRASCEAKNISGKTIIAVTATVAPIQTGYVPRQLYDRRDAAPSYPCRSDRSTRLCHV